MYECNYCQYYNDQAGSGLPIYRGVPYQRGYGIFSTYFQKYGVPLLHYLGKQIFTTGKNWVNDVATDNMPAREALRKHGKSLGKALLVDGLEQARKRASQIGTGRKRKRRRAAATKKSKTPKRKSNKRRKSTTKSKKSGNRKSKKSASTRKRPRKVGSSLPALPPLPSFSGSRPYDIFSR